MRVIKALKQFRILPKQRKARVVKRFANFVPRGLPRLWTHFWIGARHFAAAYSLPLIMTAVFLLIVALAAYLRVSQRSALAGLLAGTTNAGQGYGTLLSNDKTEELKKNSDTKQPGAQAAAGTPTSFAINPGTNTDSGSPDGGGTIPKPVFSATIASFQQDNVALECDGVQQNKPNCSKRYFFSAQVNTQNGPGLVNFGWRSNLAGASEDANYSAGNGSASKSLQKSISIACLSPGTYTMQFVILSPVQAQSNTLSINHNCVGI